MRHRKGSQEHTEVCGVCVWCPLPGTSAESVRAPRLTKGSVAPRARHLTTIFRNFGCAAFSGSRHDLLENHHLGNSKGPQAGSVLWRRTRTAAACLGEAGERGCGKPSALAACDTRRQGGARPVCLTQDWIGPTGDTTKQRFGSTKLKV